ncbi:cell division protein FtsA [Paucilactobacillus hokkaidonensis JCM 18461]|uniref:Cell division protein FtsA n=2 Tax=Paucilactobacillus hokkaidonensis TaxID=1193095 RepID=A0A0A1GYC8_9LACO|nr:cell division protein FtsA [Paucilactobacillus hokkaidonensis]KRO09933.1 cell division protein FtsA [Paucilactobacillus hokkaidonensis]BAP85914.1 cell division protein FtsA [Paucilactobacillus hokkaidonensis JCM 18461]
MDNSGIYVGLDIGTTSIKAIVCENVKGQLNVVGVGNQPSAGLNRGIIVDIDKTAQAISKAVAQAEEKSNVKIKDVVVGLPANYLKIEKCRGMITVASQNQSREITDQDVVDVAKAALTQNIPPEREVIDLLADEFIVDGFDQIKDPRGMVGVRLELHGTLFTGPKTVVHNTKKAIQKAGLNVRDLVVAPLAIGANVLNDGEQDFGTIVIDLGGGQTTTSVIHDHKLKFSYVDAEGGQYITKDISVVLNTSLQNAERLKRDYGFADSSQASESNTFTVEVVGQQEPTEVSEQYLAQVIEARVSQIFERISARLTDIKALELPGGIVLTGGVAALPGVAELASQHFGVNARVYVPDQMGIRHPGFTQGLSLASYEAGLVDIDLLIKQALLADNELKVELQSGNKTAHTVSSRTRKKAAQETKQAARETQTQHRQKPTEVQTRETDEEPEQKQPKKDRFEGIKNFFNNFFD